MMKVEKFARWAGLAAVVLAVCAFVPGCESGGGDDDKGGSNSVVGKWAMNEGSTANGNAVSWYQFNADGTFVQYNDSGFTSAHLSGTFSQNGTKVTGPFHNPGVGDGEIDCMLSGDGKSMQMDFIEHWHDPYKHVPFTGTKL